MGRHKVEVDLRTALAMAAAELGEAARHAGGGLRVTGRWARGAGTRRGRRAWQDALRSAQRAGVAYRIMCGADLAERRSIRGPVVAGLVGGTLGVAATLVIQRVRSERTGGGVAAEGSAQAPAPAPAGTGVEDSTARPAPNEPATVPPAAARNRAVMSAGPPS
ncbi:MAG TPA: hypothetical protein VES42_22555 [Pilimelia sp.]|nr:hypothetical protein [Pilimelia sp.]